MPRNHWRPIALISVLSRRTELLRLGLGLRELGMASLALTIMGGLMLLAGLAAISLYKR